MKSGVVQNPAFLGYTRDAQRVGPRTTLREKMGPEWNGVWLV
jgi:hypothetical protein